MSATGGWPLAVFVVLVLAAMVIPIVRARGEASSQVKRTRHKDGP